MQPYGSYPERSLVGCCFTSGDFVLYTFRATGRPGTSRGLCMEEKGRTGKAIDNFKEMHHVKVFMPVTYW